jgi:hypothetical protein
MISFSPSLRRMASSPGSSNWRGMRTAWFRPFLTSLTCSLQGHGHSVGICSGICKIVCRSAGASCRPRDRTSDRRRTGTFMPFSANLSSKADPGRPCPQSAV